jgi:hypothetical protein
MKRILPAIVLLLFAAPAWAGEAELTADIRAMLAGLPPLAGKKVTAET